MNSRNLVREVLSTRTADEASARKVLEAAFDGDGRLQYGNRGWSLVRSPRRAVGPAVTEPDRALVILKGQPAGRGQPFRLTSVSAIRIRGDDVLGACGGDARPGRDGARLRGALRETLAGAVPVLHDPPGSLAALESWLDLRLEGPVSLRRLGQDRLGLSASHTLSDLAGSLGLQFRDVDDPLEEADTVDSCLAALLGRDETLTELRMDLGRVGRGIDWSRFGFDRGFLEAAPRAPGTYRFFDREGRLLYVGKTKNLHSRLNSYFGNRVPARARQLVAALHRIEYEPTGSALEATLREARQIASRRPSANVQRRIHGRSGRGQRLRSILILEPAEPPHVLLAFLIREGRLLGRIPIGPRGGGLRQISRLLEAEFFGRPDERIPGPRGADLDVELIVRWLAENRDRVVAFDPTDLADARDVIERLRWFLAQGGPFDPDGRPIVRD